MSHAIRRTAGLAAAGGLILSAGLIETLPASAHEDANGPSYIIVYETQLSGSAADRGWRPRKRHRPSRPRIAGTPVTINVCDDQGTTTGNIDCEHEAVADNAALFVVTQASQDQSLVDASNIPVVGVANDTSPQSFDVSAEQGLFAGMAVALQKKGCKNIGQVIDEGGESDGDQVAKAVKWQSVTDAYIPLTAPDLSPDIVKLTQAHVQCIDMACSPRRSPRHSSPSSRRSFPF